MRTEQEIEALIQKLESIESNWIEDDMAKMTDKAKDWRNCLEWVLDNQEGNWRVHISDK